MRAQNISFHKSSLGQFGLYAQSQQNYALTYVFNIQKNWISLPRSLKTVLLLNTNNRPNTMLISCVYFLDFEEYLKYNTNSFKIKSNIRKI